MHTLYSPLVHPIQPLKALKIPTLENGIGETPHQTYLSGPKFLKFMCRDMYNVILPLVSSLHNRMNFRSMLLLSSRKGRLLEYSGTTLQLLDYL